MHWITKEVGRKIGSVFKQVTDVIIPQSTGKKGKHLKILVLTDLLKPLLRGTVVKLVGSTKWVAFKYRKVSRFLL